ncbi:MAG: hypothetical protein AAFR98_05235 [Pseudomonadota bacterium]
MRRLIKGIFYLAVITLVGLIGYSYFGDMSPNQSPVRVAIDLPEGDGNP